MKWFFAIIFSFSLIFLANFCVNCLYGYIFPQKFADEVYEASETFDVEPATIFSLINIESHFRKDAVSQKGAVGLMQIMPSTADESATEIEFGEYDLKCSEDNIFLGTYYLSTMIDKFGDLETALCAYNAGPANVKKWLSNPEFSDDGKSIKKIPFEETRNYVSKFWQNYRYYSRATKK